MAVSNRSLAARNNNPLNLRPGQPYEGLATPSENAGFCNFKSPVWGFRAAFRNYITKYDRGVDTITKLITEWAPPSDNNDTAAYIKSVSQKTGFGADDKIALKTWDVASAVCYAQAEVESGGSFESAWTQTQMSEGAFRAGIVDAPPPLSKKIGSTIAASGGGVAAGAAAVQSAVETYNQSPHSPRIFIGLCAVSAILALLAAVLKPQTKTEG